VQNTDPWSHELVKALFFNPSAPMTAAISIASLSDAVFPVEDAP
jgi:hypothetical protein